RHQDVVVTSYWVQRRSKRQEVAGDEPRPLMDQLVEGVLAIGSRLAEVDRASVTRYLGTVERNAFPEALHGQLLQVGWEAFQVLLIRQDRNRFGDEEVVVPDRQKAHEYRQVAFERSRTEVFVHLVATVQHGAEIIRADCQHGREPDRRSHRVAPTYPVPELEHVGRVDTKRRALRRIRRDSHKMF